MITGKNTDIIMEQLVDEYLDRDGRELNKEKVMRAFEVIGEIGNKPEMMEAVTRFYNILRAFDSTEMVYPSSADTNDSFAE